MFLRDGTPFPFKRTLVSVWVPGFTSYSTSPSTVLMRIVPPSAAFAKEIGTVEKMLVSWRLKIGCWDTVISTRRSPLSPPPVPGSPFPAMRMLWPLSMPAGTVTWIFLRFVIYPVP